MTSVSMPSVIFYDIHFNIFGQNQQNLRLKSSWDTLKICDNSVESIYRTGGLMELGELRQRLVRSRGRRGRRSGGSQQQAQQQVY